MLAVSVQIFPSYRVRVQPLVVCVPVVQLCPAAGDPAVDNKVDDVDILWGKLSRDILGHSPQCEFAHGKRCLDAQVPALGAMDGRRAASDH